MKNEVSVQFKNSKGFMAKTGVIVAASVASAGAFAVDHSAAITAAQTDASTSVTTVVTGLIALVAIIAGVSLVISLLSKK